MMFNSSRRLSMFSMCTTVLLCSVAGPCSGAVYGEPCDVDSDCQNYGTACRNVDGSYMCKCDSAHYFENGCQSKKWYGSPCTSPHQCNDAINLVCILRVCNCSGRDVWVKTGTPSCHPVPCKSASDCRQDRGLGCSAGNCLCSSTHYWDDFGDPEMCKPVDSLVEDDRTAAIVGGILGAIIVILVITGGLLLWKRKTILRCHEKESISDEQRYDTLDFGNNPDEQNQRRTSASYVNLELSSEQNPMDEVEGDTKNVEEDNVTDTEETAESFDNAFHGNDLDYKAINIMANDHIVLHNWKNIGRRLQLTEADITQIEFKYEKLGPKEQLLQVILKWQNCKGRMAMNETLIKALEEEECKACADKLTDYLYDS